MNKRTLIAVLVCAAIAGGGFLLLHRGSEEAEAEVTPSARVKTVPLQRRPISESLEVFGVVEPAPSAEQVVSATYECVVVAVHAVPGARVAQGEVVAQIAPSPESRLLLESARTSLSAAEEGLAAVRERYELRLATHQDLLTAQQAERDARAKLASYQARGMENGGALKAPVSGVISKLELTTGSLIAAGTPLFAVAGSGGLEAHLSVEGGEAMRLSAGQSVALKSVERTDVNGTVDLADSAGSSAGGAAAVSSRIRVVGTALNPTTGAADARVPIPASAPLVLGEHVRAIIEVSKRDSAWVVPRSAVLPDDDKQVVYTVKDGKAVRHEVAVGATSGDDVEVIAADLHPGDAVVSVGNFELTDGMGILQ